jgi:hypothetical protein
MLPGLTPWTAAKTGRFVLAAQKKIVGSGWFSCSPKARPRPWRQASVDKPMHIHRIECAKPAELDTADLLSS